MKRTTHNRATATSSVCQAAEHLRTVAAVDLHTGDHTSNTALLEPDVVKEKAKITVPILEGTSIAPPDGDGFEELAEEDAHMEEHLGAHLHRFGLGDGIIPPAAVVAALCEDTLGLAFDSSMAGSANQGQQQQSSFNDDLALMVGRPDEHGFFHCPADACDRKYKIKYSLLRHLRNECNADRRHSCPKCDKKFSYAFILNRHLLNVHKESPGYY
ncbi:uncharacterized protein LOC126560750 [Anopheles maculipalpis]|uniref:uncharacterized protein LOC126560750 n=1 Tax=Anopheles maculipalpis TaxID=1496333 RepID=UPI0021595E72|nr:uncharacterized protein LOC126560750 [Anopheles maculipalpis]